MFLNRHVELEKDKQREKKLQKMKKNLKLLMIALIVLAIEKLSEFVTALISGSHPNHAATLVSLIFSIECLKKRPFIVEKLMLLPSTSSCSIFMSDVDGDCLCLP